MGANGVNRQFMNSVDHDYSRVRDGSIDLGSNVYTFEARIGRENYLMSYLRFKEQDSPC